MGFGGGDGGGTMSTRSIGDYAHYTDDEPDIQRGDGDGRGRGRAGPGRGLADGGPPTMGTRWQIGESTQVEARQHGK